MRKLLICTLLLLFHFMSGMAQLKPIRGDLNSIYSENKKTLKLGFSEVTLDEMDRLRNSVDAFVGMKGFADYKSRVYDFWKKYCLYKDAIDALCRLDGWQDAKNLREQIIPYLDKKKKDDPKKGFYALSSKQYKELDDLDIALSRFKIGIQTFQSLITTINNDETIKSHRQGRGRKNERQERCMEEIKALIYNSKDGQNMTSKFSVIPILNEKLEKYKQDIERNSLKNSKVETEILNIYIE